MNYKVHEIKLLEDYCDAVLSGEKTFEVRKNDRGYQKGDHVSFTPVDRSYLKFYHPVSEKEYEITYVHSGLGLENGYVVFGIKDISGVTVAENTPKMGRWVDIMVGDMPAQVCDQCNTFYPLAYTGGGHKYCPNCGAKMAEREDKE